MLPEGWLTNKLLSGLGEDGAMSGGLEVSTSIDLADSEDILRALDVGVEIPTARTLDGGGVSDSSSVPILRFLESVEGVTQEGHFQSLGWVLDLRLL